MKRRLRRAGYAALRQLSAPWRSVTGLLGSPLRILAYHDVPDGDIFSRQMSHLAEHYQVVSGSRSATGPGDGPPVWITFDDGDPTIVDNALDVLSRYGFYATAFICPAMIGTTEPFWWQVVHAASEAGVTVAGKNVSSDEVSRLKSMPDAERRKRVSAVREQLSIWRGEDLVRRQLTHDELKMWLDAGHSLGNHSWDHPILDQCTPEEQRRQIDLSHEWFLANGYEVPRWFAYPNGNWSYVAEQRLVKLRYESSLLFDHRLASIHDGMNLSRIRVNGSDSLNEFISKVSGLHPATSRWRL